MPPALLLLMQLVLGTLFGLLGLVVAAPLTAVAIAAGRDVYVKRWLERREG
jgi:predicted PurR-regulated permease PerM